MSTFRFRWPLLVLPFALLLGGCNATHERTVDQPDPSYDPTVSATDTTKQKPEDVGKLVGMVVREATAADALQTREEKKRDEVKIEMREDLLRQRFIHEFGDGTVVDKAVITPIRDNPGDKPTYYLVGMGQLNGEYRAMALRLEVTAQGNLFLKPYADRYIASGTNCPMCYYRYSRGQITGVECADASTGRTQRRCELKKESGNRLFPQALKAEPISRGRK